MYADTTSSAGGDACGRDEVINTREVQTRAAELTSKVARLPLRLELRWLAGAPRLAFALGALARRGLCGGRVAHEHDRLIVRVELDGLPSIVVAVSERRARARGLREPDALLPRLFVL